MTRCVVRESVVKHLHLLRFTAVTCSPALSRSNARVRAMSDAPVPHRAPEQTTLGAQPAPAGGLEALLAQTSRSRCVHIKARPSIRAILSSRPKFRVFSESCEISSRTASSIPLFGSGDMKDRAAGQVVHKLTATEPARRCYLGVEISETKRRQEEKRKISEL